MKCFHFVTFFPFISVCCDLGWWFVSVQDSQGWAPGTFLTKADGPEDEEESIAGNSECSLNGESESCLNTCTCEFFC